MTFRYNEITDWDTEGIMFLSSQHTMFMEMSGMTLPTAATRELLSVRQAVQILFSTTTL